jgi:hypothetical protein
MRPRFLEMIRLPVGTCRSCGAAVGHLARACPRCRAPNLPNPVATIAALSAVAIVGGLIALSVTLVRGLRAPESAPSAGSAPGASAPTADTSTAYGWIVKAMAECEEEAKQRQDTLHFLIIPVTTTGLSLPGWSPSPIGPVGDSVTLFNSSDTLIGLRNGALALYRKPLTFALSDPATQTVYKWKPATGVTALKTRDSGIGSVTLGFEIPDVAKDIAWGPTINLSKGNCYWINPVVHAAGDGG